MREIVEIISNVEEIQCHLTLICPLQAPVKSMILYHPDINGNPADSTVRSRAENPIVHASPRS